MLASSCVSSLVRSAPWLQVLVVGGSDPLVCIDHHQCFTGQVDSVRNELPLGDASSHRSRSAWEAAMFDNVAQKSGAVVNRCRNIVPDGTAVQSLKRKKVWRRTRPYTPHKIYPFRLRWKPIFLSGALRSSASVIRRLAANTIP